jgi:hypothetical protein
MSQVSTSEEKLITQLAKLNLSRMVGALWSYEEDLYRRRAELERNFSVNLPHQRISRNHFAQLQSVLLNKEARVLYRKICQRALTGEMVRETSLNEGELSHVKALQSLGFVFRNSKVKDFLKSHRDQILKDFKSIPAATFEEFLEEVESGIVLPRALGASSPTGLYFVPVDFLSKAYIMNQVTPPFLMGAIHFLVKSARSWDRGLHGDAVWGWGSEDRPNDVYSTCFALRAIYNFYQNFGISYRFSAKDIITLISGTISWIVSAQNIDTNIERWKRSNWREEMAESSKALRVDGGWGARKGQESSPESTGLVLYTLKDLGVTIEGEEAGYRFLETTAKEYDTNMVKWSNRVSDTAFAVLALLRSDKREHRALATKGRNWLFSVQNTPNRFKRIEKSIHEELKSIREEEQEEILDLIMSVDYGWPRAQWGHSRNLQTTLMFNFFTEITCRIDDFKVTKKIRNEMLDFTKRMLSWQEEGHWSDAWNTGFIMWDLSTLYQKFPFDKEIRNYIYNSLNNCVKWFGKTQHDEYLCWSNPEKPLTSTTPAIGLGHYYNLLLKDSPKVDAHDLLKLAVETAIKSAIFI